MKFEHKTKLTLFEELPAPISSVPDLMKSLVALLNLQKLYEFKRIMHILKNVVVDYKVNTLPLTYDQIFHCFCHPFLAKKNHFLLPTIFLYFLRMA
jgi:hypothetical protein